MLSPRHHVSVTVCIMSHSLSLRPFGSDVCGVYWIISKRNAKLYRGTCSEEAISRWISCHSIQPHLNSHPKILFLSPKFKGPVFRLPTKKGVCVCARMHWGGWGGTNPSKASNITRHVSCKRLTSGERVKEKNWVCGWVSIAERNTTTKGIIENSSFASVLVVRVATSPRCWRPEGYEIILQAKDPGRPQGCWVSSTYHNTSLLKKNRYTQKNNGYINVQETLLIYSTHSNETLL